jgi:hypothetical protein
MYRLPPLFLLLLVFALSAPVLFGQGSAISRTDLGKSQNTREDLVNSLAPGPVKYGKGEKKAEIDPKTLPSKKSNDTMFSGGLNDLGVDWSGDKMGKPHGAKDSSSKPATTADGSLKDSKSEKSSTATSDVQGKEQGSTTSKSEEKPSEKAKTSFAKTDGDHS